MQPPRPRTWHNGRMAAGVHPGCASPCCCTLCCGTRSSNSRRHNRIREKECWVGPCTLRRWCAPKIHQLDRQRHRLRPNRGPREVDCGRLDQLVARQHRPLRGVAAAGRAAVATGFIWDAAAAAHHPLGWEAAAAAGLADVVYKGDDLHADVGIRALVAGGGKAKNRLVIMSNQARSHKGPRQRRWAGRGRAQRLGGSRHATHRRHGRRLHLTLAHATNMRNHMDKDQSASSQYDSSPAG